MQSDQYSTPPDPTEVYCFNTKASQAVDKAAIERYGIPSIILMENAALGLAAAVSEMLEQLEIEDESPSVLIICGGGNNGGDGFALARHLHNSGIQTVIVAISQPKKNTDAYTNSEICMKMRLQIADADSLDKFADSDLIVDAIFGTGLDRAIEGKAVEVIDWINSSQTPVISVDVPSGMDCDTGQPLGPCVEATLTVTFLGPKIGYYLKESQKYTGNIMVADIGAPSELVAEYGKPVPD